MLDKRVKEVRVVVKINTVLFFYLKRYIFIILSMQIQIKVAKLQISYTQYFSNLKYFQIFICFKKLILIKFLIININS